MLTFADLQDAVKRREGLIERSRKDFRKIWPFVIDAAAWDIWDQDLPPLVGPRPRGEVLDWLAEHTRAVNYRNLFGFCDENDAFHFKMRWA
jgi:hypothetical protein